MSNKDKDNFNWRYYILNYEDLRNNQINSENKAREHWDKYGKKEGRIANRLLYFFSNNKLDNKIKINSNEIPKQIYDKNEYICVKPFGGLCNYLRVIFSYYKYAQSNKKKLIVIWEITKYCNGFFLDYFDSIENVFFIKYDGLLGYAKKYKNIRINYIGNLWHSDYNPNIYSGYLYNDLKLKEEYYSLVQKFLKKNNNYISVHIRRTDHILCNAELTTDDCFINFIEENLNNYKNMNVYIATDNRSTQQKFKELFPNNIVFHSEIKNSTKLRKTKLDQAIIDLYICVYSYKFKGSYYSSFTDLILEMRKKK